MSTQPRTKTLWVQETYLNQILAGRKTVEVRVGYSNILRLRAGDFLRLNLRHLYVIDRIAVYKDFEELLAHENHMAIAPDVPEEELLSVIRGIYPRDLEALGAVAIEIAPAPDPGT